MTKPLFLTLEGIDGSGKTTQSKYLSNILTDRGISNIYTREPGGPGVAEALRTLVLVPDFDIDINTERLLFMAARSHHLEYKIKPALASGQWVVCDRYMDSTLAYQCKSVEEMWEVQEWAYSMDWMLVPDYTLYLAIDAETAFKRMKFRGQSLDRTERDFENRVHKMIALYEELDEHCDHYIRIDANVDDGQVKEQIEAFISQLK